MKLVLLIVALYAFHSNVLGLSPVKKKITAGMSWPLKTYCIKTLRETSALYRRQNFENKDENSMKTKVFRLMYEMVRDGEMKIRKAEKISRYWYTDKQAFQPYVKLGFLTETAKNRYTVLKDIGTALQRMHDEWKAIEHVNAYEQFLNIAHEIDNIIKIYDHTLNEFYDFLNQHAGKIVENLLERKKREKQMRKEQEKKRKEEEKRIIIEAEHRKNEENLKKNEERKNKREKKKKREEKLKNKERKQKIEQEELKQNLKKQKEWEEKYEKKKTELITKKKELERIKKQQNDKDEELQKIRKGQRKMEAEWKIKDQELEAREKIQADKDKEQRHKIEELREIEKNLMEKENQTKMDKKIQKEKEIDQEKLGKKLEEMTAELNIREEYQNITKTKLKVWKKKLNDEKSELNRKEIEMNKTAESQKIREEHRYYKEFYKKIKGLEETLKKERSRNKELNHLKIEILDTFDHLKHKEDIRNLKRNQALQKWFDRIVIIYNYEELDRTINKATGEDLKDLKERIDVVKTQRQDVIEQLMENKIYDPEQDRNKTVEQRRMDDSIKIQQLENKILEAVTGENIKLSNIKLLELRLERLDILSFWNWMGMEVKTQSAFKNIVPLIEEINGHLPY